MVKVIDGFVSAEDLETKNKAKVEKSLLDLKEKMNQFSTFQSVLQKLCDDNGKGTSKKRSPIRTQSVPPPPPPPPPSRPSAPPTLKKLAQKKTIDFKELLDKQKVFAERRKRFMEKQNAINNKSVSPKKKSPPP